MCDFTAELDGKQILALPKFTTFKGSELVTFKKNILNFNNANTKNAFTHIVNVAQE